jgi:hypothetical protein
MPTASKPESPEAHSASLFQNRAADGCYLEGGVSQVNTKTEAIFSFCKLSSK